MAIKVKIIKDNFSLNYNFYIYFEDEYGNIYDAEPVDIVIKKEKTEPASMVMPTFQLNGRAFDVEIENAIKPISDQLLKEKEKDKNFHIESLEKIIDRFIK